MKKHLFLGLTLGVLLASGCSSLPEGTGKPKVQVTSCRLAAVNQAAGVYVDYSVHHSLSKPLQLKRKSLEVSLNGRKVGSLDEETDNLISPNLESSFSVFVPLNSQLRAGRDSIRYNRMLSAAGRCSVKLFFNPGGDDSFNPGATYTGIITHGGN